MAKRFRRACKSISFSTLLIRNVRIGTETTEKKVFLYVLSIILTQTQSHISFISYSYNIAKRRDMYTLIH